MSNRVGLSADECSIPSTVHIRFKRKKSWNDEGVAATVGTILSLMVFLTFLGMFTNQYVPVWMKENENNHMSHVIGQLSSLRAGIDMQILASNEENTASAPLYYPIQLHAEGVPIFSTPTMGTLSFTTNSPGYPSFVVTYPYRVTDGAGYDYYTLNSTNGGRAGGSLDFYGPNRYYIQQTVAYENGAMILNQTDGEIVLSGLSIKVLNYSGIVTVKLTQVSLSGINKTIGGFGTKSITSSLEYASKQRMENTTASGATLTLNFTSEFGDAWESYLTGLRNASGTGLPLSNWSVSKSAIVVDDVTYYSVTLSIVGVHVLEYTKAMVSISVTDISVT